MTGRQQKFLLQWFVFLVLVLVAAHGSRGSLSFLHQFSRRSEPISRVLLSPDTTFSEVRISEASLISPSLPPQESPMAGIISPGPDAYAYAAQPPLRETTTPTHSPKNGDATTPTPPMVPEGSLQNPPTMSMRPEVLPPAILGLVPPPQPSSPSDHVTPGARSSPPSLQTLPPAAPNRPAGAPDTGVNGQTHTNSSPVALPSNKGSVPPRVGGSNHDIAPPTASPPTETHAHLSPTTQLLPNGTLVSSAPATTPAISGTRFSEPVPAPQNNFSSSSSPPNHFPSKGPAVSPPLLANPPNNHKDRHRISPAASPGQISSNLKNHSHANGPAVSITSPPPTSHGERNDIPVSAPSNELPGSLVSPPPAIAPAASPGQISSNLKNHSHGNGPTVSPPTSPPTSHGEKNDIPVAAPSNELPGSVVSPPPVVAPAINHGTPSYAPSTSSSVHLSPKSHPARANVSSPAISPVPPEAATPSAHRSSPPSYAKPTAAKTSHGPAPAVKSHQGPARGNAPAHAPSSHFPSKPPHPAISPSDEQKHHPPATDAPGPSTPHHAGNRQGAPTPSLPNRLHNNTEGQGAPTPSLSTRLHNNTKGRGQAQPPALPPSASISDHQRAPKLQPIHAFPPPPPNLECAPLLCTAPLTNTPPGSPCSCVLPIKVGLRLSISLYTFFPLVSELAEEIASGVLMEQSQVRIMGANADSENIDQTIVLIDLVPRGENFANVTFFMVYQKFWHKKVLINPSHFGDYTVLYVRYPGLPPSPPMVPGNIYDGGSGVDPRTIHPLAVDVGRQKGKQNAGVIAIIVLSVIIIIVLCFGGVGLLFLKYRSRPQFPTSTTKTLQPPLAGTGPTLSGSRHGSESISFTSSIAPYTGSAKTFSLDEMERATNRFNELRTIGEGGFGRVYEGTLDDGTRVAVKVLKRDDQQGSREFIAEVEMLSRLHHRNLIKLIGICTESQVRCLVYELLQNGSVESHLHGADKEIAPLDWNARLKIALGAARGLAYLHEDSSPRVIHRDFKSSNILLEEDFTPKVSDFGLARAALGEGHEYISTRVMGTFGYVAPEYAMTGHLLVKSDVYSYGVVLLELLTGRKPVDMLRPPGQESLVTWARPYLISKEGLESILDPSLGTDIPYDSVAKVAAIASMCVQPEVDQRPFMGEVVQALKLVCNDGDDYRGSELYSQDDRPACDREISISMGWESESEKVLSASDIFNPSTGFTKDVSGSCRRYSSSGPLRPGSKGMFSQTTHGLSTGSTSDHGKYGKGFDTREQWP